MRRGRRAGISIDGEISGVSSAAIAFAVTLCVTAVSAPPAASAAEGQETASVGEVAAALSGPAAAQVAKAVESASTADAAAITTGAVRVTVPVEAVEGVQLALDSTTVSIQLPQADEATRAVKLDSGAITFPSETGVANTVVPLDDGAQLLTTIPSKNAPISFPYDVSSSDDAAVYVASDGSALVMSESGDVLLRAAAPWAVDANGTSVPTRYEVQGTELIQVVDHTAGDFAYPILADPRFDQGIGWKSILFNRHETGTIAGAGLLAHGGAATACGVGGPPAVAACALASAALGATAVYARDNGQCVGLSFWGVAPPAMGWNPFLHNGADCN